MLQKIHVQVQKKSVVQELIQNKLQLFGHVEGMTVEK